MNLFDFNLDLCQDFLLREHNPPKSEILKLNFKTKTNYYFIFSYTNQLMLSYIDLYNFKKFITNFISQRSIFTR